MIINTILLRNKEYQEAVVSSLRGLEVIQFGDDAVLTYEEKEQEKDIRLAIKIFAVLAGAEVNLPSRVENKVGRTVDIDRVGHIIKDGSIIYYYMQCDH